MKNPKEELFAYLDICNEYLESENEKFRYAIVKKKIIAPVFVPEPLKFLVIDECENDTDALQTYFKLYSAICYLKNISLKYDIVFEKMDSSIKKILSPYASNLYDLIKVENIHRIRHFGELRYDIVNKYLKKFGLHFNMSNSDILKSNFFFENKFNPRSITNITNI